MNTQRCIIGVAVYDTEQNERSGYTKKTFESLVNTVNPRTTRVIFIDNDSCEETKKFLSEAEKNSFVEVITNDSNLGTAEAINLAMKQRKEDQYFVKMDNDVVIYESGWIEKMIRCFERDPALGVLGLKRKDLPNQPDSEKYPTELKFLPHELGEPWLIVETCEDIIGTCTMYSPALLKAVGYLYQPTVYGFDDVLMCVRARLCGFYNAFYPSIEIEHIDDGKNPFTDWKKKHAGKYLGKIDGIIRDYADGMRDLYYNPYV